MLLKIKPEISNMVDSQIKPEISNMVDDMVDSLKIIHSQKRTVMTQKPFTRTCFNNRVP